MQTQIAAALLAVAIAGGGYAGWRVYAELGNVRAELTGTKVALEQAKTEAKAAKEKTNELARERDELKIAEAGLRAERDSARMLIESAQRQNERMAQDMVLMQQQLAYLRARAGTPAQFAQPQLMPQRPMVIQALPAPRPQSATVGVSVSAPVPGQGYGGR
jgi:hypothetical protein